MYFCSKYFFMLKLGQYQTLTINRQAPPGMYLINQENDEVLLPNKYIPENVEIGAELKVFVYLDHEERPVATTLQPFIKLDEFARLRCVEVTNIGAFLDWGLEKHLFVPFKEQAYPMEKGHWYLVFCYLDEETQRLVASSKVNHFLDNTDLTVAPFEQVELIVTNKTELGYNTIVNELHQGLIYHSDVFQNLQTGDKLKGWIKKIREDHKIDVVLQRPGYRSIEPNADKIMHELQLNDGFLALHDKSNPEEIRSMLQMSKKSFKKAIGKLYKKREIKIVPQKGIYLQ